MISRLIKKMLEGDRHALARLFTLLDRDPLQSSAIMKALSPHARMAYCIGLTGLPGAGKSTIVNGLVQTLRNQGLSIGVLAVDPTSPFGSGAILGDRVRMQQHYLDSDVFIRSLATRGSGGGISRITGASVKLLGASGKDIIIVETVGIGQTELDIMKVADTVVVTLTPEAGDSVQAMKAGLMEIADIFVVNKADRPGATRLASTIKGMLKAGDRELWWKPPVLLTQANKGKGIQPLNDGILQHRMAMEETSRLADRRRQRRVQEFDLGLRDAINSGISALLLREGILHRITTQIQNGDLDPYSAVSQAIGDSQFINQLSKQLKTHQSDTRQSVAEQKPKISVE